MDVYKVINGAIGDIQCTRESEGKNIKEILNKEIFTDADKDYIYTFFLNSIETMLRDFLKKCEDTNKDKGMYKCSLETWQSFCDIVGREFFRKHDYMADKPKRAKYGGVAYRDDLLLIGMEIYEHLCRTYRKQFFIYDCALFMGINRDVIYELNTKHADILKKAHTMQESSMRTALASGRANVTAMAILLNHDYDYTRTTQVVHTIDRIKTADTLPMLGGSEKPKTEQNEINDIM